MCYVQVALLSPPYSILTYAAPGWLPPGLLVKGLRVAVPLGGKGLRCGLVLGCEAQLDPEDTTPAKTQPMEIKPIVWPLEKEPLLSAEYLAMLEQLALRQAVGLGRILGSVLPAGLKSTTGVLRYFAPAGPQSYKISALKNQSEQYLSELALAWLSGKAELLPSEANLAALEFCTVAKDPPWPVRPAAKKQLEVLEFLWEQGGKTRRQLLTQFGQSVAPVLKTLLGHGLLKMESANQRAEFMAEADLLLDDKSVSEAESEELRLEHLVEELAFAADEPCADDPGPDFKGDLFDLTSEQAEALRGLNQDLAQAKMQAALLHGVTGSGKTAVYLELAGKCLKEGRSALLLAPEVALACKLYQEARKHLPEAQIYLAHGYQASARREKIFRDLASKFNRPKGDSSPLTTSAQADKASTANSPKNKTAKTDNVPSPVLVVGTRSSLFLPLRNLGLIVLDEEHDASFKQDEGLVYQAKDLAYFLAVQNNSLLLLGSATPDVRTFQACCQNDMPLYSLKQRLGGASLPELTFVDIRKQRLEDGILAPESLEALRQTVENGQQAVILLNRRGYAPLLYCLECSQVVRCPHCDIGLTFHKARQRTVCHYCGYSSFFPMPCERCKSLNYLPMGEGTEKLEESLLPHLPPGVKVLRLDRDTTRRPGRMEEILAAFAREEAQILVGTQMLSKGHHFPKVTLAIVADADLGLNLPEYQAAERTFQLVLQAAGRAGRGSEKGKVVVQTRDPNHFCWQFVQQGDYQGFFEQEINLRRLRRYPPFVKLGLVRFSFPLDWPQGQDLVNQLGKILKEKGHELGLSVLGPAPAPLGLLRGQKRLQCLLKGQSWVSIRQVYAAALGALGSLGGAGRLRVSLDIDPGSLL